ncbi:MAG: hypothetical protein JW797_10895 [Bradymonadales bacterium]|nr:hypothetical protein [Bradymonadales bacterium]
MGEEKIEITTGRGILLQKAYFYDTVSKETIGVLYNPTEVSVNKAVGWNFQAKPKKGQGFYQFTASQPRSLSLKLEYDTSGLENPDPTKEANWSAQDVRWAIDPLYAMTNNSKKKQPPEVIFGWGNGLRFNCVIKSMNVTFTKFNPDGVPIRANVAVELLEKIDPAAGNTGAGSGGEAESGTLATMDASSTASHVSGRTSQEQQDKWRETMEKNPDAFKDGNPRQGNPGQPTLT